MHRKCFIHSALLWLVLNATAHEANQYQCSREAQIDYYGFIIKQISFLNVTIEGSATPQFLCDYIYNIKAVKFESSTLDEVPKQLFDTFNNLWVVNFTGSGIKHVNRYSLERAINLQNLDLSNNALEQLNANCFAGPTALLELNVSFNNISFIDKMAFNSLSSLILLRLTGNKLSSLDSKVFEPLVSLDSIFLNFNQLQTIESGLFAKNKRLNYVFLHYNMINVVEEGAFGDPLRTESAMSFLSFIGNKLTKLNVENVKVCDLYLSRNELEELHLSPWVQVVFADFNRIRNITVSDMANMQLRTLRITGNSITSLESIQHFRSLTDLDLSYNKIGPLNVTSLTKLNKLEKLCLQGSSISNLERGTFANQKALKWLDISYNKLERFDINILSSSSTLEMIYLEGNRLKSINYEHLRKTFPNLAKVGLSNNNWNCTYLSQLVRYCTEHSIELFKPQTLVQNRTNVMGIYCYDDRDPVSTWNNTLENMQSLIHCVNGRSNAWGLKGNEYAFAVWMMVATFILVEIFKI